MPLALSQRDQLDARGLTSVAGNIQLNYTSRNARMVREWANRPDPKSMTIATLEPQINLALALIQHPEIAQGIREVVMIGGAHFNGGKISRPWLYSTCAPIRMPAIWCSRAACRSR